MTSASADQRALELVFGEGADRVCRDIPDEACHEQPRNLSLHLAALTATKTGDGIVDPKLVLSWLVSALGGSALAVGLLVPLREAFALLPQLFIGHRIRRLPRRKFVWAAASFMQGLAVAAMGVAVLVLPEAAAVWAVVGLVLVFAIGRSAASVSYKDVLGKTVSKSRRGTVTGTATSVSAVVVLGLGGGLAAGVIPLSSTTIAIGLLGAGGLWFLAGALFLRVVEAEGATEGGVDGVRAAFANLGVLREDPQLARFVATRSLLTVTAIAPPYLLALTESGEQGLGSLGPFVVASSIATIVGGRVWGRLSDRSSRQVLVGAAGAGVLLFTLAGIGAATLPDLLAQSWVAAGLLFLVVLAYQGVRLGRATHLVDMAAAEDRATYTAVSNTVVGVVILCTGAFGALSELIGLPGLFAVFAAVCGAAFVIGRGLEEVQVERD
ncbi:MAG: MFS transporter [Acidimicrobiia bacterium]